MSAVHCTTATQICPECRKTFVPYNNRQNVVFCSYKCQVAYNVAKRRSARRAALASCNATCPWCSSAFAPTSCNHAFCSDTCRDRFKASQRQGRIVAERVRIKCGVCGGDFLPLNGNAKYCSRPCRQKGQIMLARSRKMANPAKERAYQSDYRRRNNEAVRKHRLKNWYGITLEEYNRRLAEQGGRCAVCREVLATPHVDHEHGHDGNVRGLLCGPCNMGLGHFRDNIELLLRAAKYLRKHGSGRKKAPRLSLPQGKRTPKAPEAKSLFDEQGDLNEQSNGEPEKVSGLR
jgi:hypothetical protein